MDEVEVLHRHDEGSHPMRVTRIARLDHIVVENLRCACGSERALLTRLRDGGDGEHELIEWPHNVSTGSSIAS